MPRNLKNYIHEKSAEPHTVSVAVVCTLLIWLSNNKISAKLVLVIYKNCFSNCFLWKMNKEIVTISVLFSLYTVYSICRLFCNSCCNSTPKLSAISCSCNWLTVCQWVRGGTWLSSDVDSKYRPNYSTDHKWLIPKMTTNFRIYYKERDIWLIMGISLKRS